jgi:hypothetical protein
MAFQKAILPDCPQCNQPGLRVIESRKTAMSTRRRKKCECCGYRFTTHEVTADFFEEAKHNLYLVEQLHKLMKGTPLTSGVEPPPSGVSASEFKALNKCSDCHHNIDGCHCAFDFPEYDTAESYDCNHFQLWKSK